MVRKLLSVLLLTVLVASLLMWLTYHTRIANAQFNSTAGGGLNQTVNATTSSLSTLTTSSTSSSTTSSSTTSTTILSNSTSTTSSITTTIPTISTTSSSSTTTLLNTTSISSTTINPGNQGVTNVTVTPQFPQQLGPVALCYLISNFSRLDSAHLTLNGTGFNITVANIGTVGAGVTINGTGYALKIGRVQLLPDSPKYRFFTLLDNISYVPINHNATLNGSYSLKHAINLTVCSSPLHYANTTSTTTIQNTTTSTIMLFNAPIPNQLLRKNTLRNATASPAAKMFNNVSGYNFTSIFASYGISPIANATSFNAQSLNATQQALVRETYNAVGKRVGEVRIRVPYGTVRSGGRYLGHNDSGNYYLGQNGSSPVIYNVTVTKIVPQLTVNINGYSVSTPNVTVIHIPIIGGKVGLTGGSTYSLNSILSTSLLNNLTLTYSLSVGNTLIVNSSVNSTTLSQQINATIPINQNTTIRFDTQGNANYSAIDPTVVVSPTNVVAYLPITFTNPSATAVPANTPIAIGVLNTAGNSVIGFNAVKYSQYETCNLNNGEFFFANGTIAYSWMEGNILNEENANGICTSPSAYNSLIQSANVLYWIKVPGASYLIGSGTNTVYLGWMGNVITASNTLLNKVTTGEAPQLTCANPGASTTTCNYGQYDNGNQIFKVYENFTGNTLNTWPSGIWTGGGVASISNGMTMTGSGGVGTAMSWNVAINSFDWFGWISLASGNAGSYIAPVGNPNSNQWLLKDGSECGVGFYWQETYVSSATCAKIGTLTNNGAVYYPFSLMGQGNQQTFQAQVAYGNIYNGIIAGGFTQGATSNAFLNTYGPTDVFQWVRLRPLPPNRMMPTVAYGSVVLFPLTFNSALVPSPATQGQIETVTAYIWNGVPPYTYNILVYNSVALVANQLATSFLSFNSFGFRQSPSWGTGQMTVNFIITDSNSPVTTASNTNFYHYSITVPSPLTFNSLTIVTPVNIPYGQNQNVTAYVYNGVSPYTFNVQVFNSVGLVKSMLFANVIPPSNTFVYRQDPLWGIGTFTVNIIVIDSNVPATTVTNSLYYTYTVVNAMTMGFNSIIISNSLIHVLQTQVINTYIYNGLGPYTYNVLVYNSLGLVTNQLTVGVPVGTNAFAFTQNAAWGTGIFVVNATVTDSNTPAVVVGSTNFYNYSSENAVLVFNSVTLAYQPIDLQQTQTANAYIYNGIGPFTYNYFLYNAIGSLVASYYTPTTWSTSNSYSFMLTNSMQTGTFTLNTVAGDWQAEQVTNSLTFFVTNTLVSMTWNADYNKKMYIGQNQIIRSSLFGGTPPYSFNILIYNAIGSLVFNSLGNSIYASVPDVVVLHSNGIIQVYNASSNSDNARGAALGSALTAAVTGDKIYLKSETYNVVPQGGVNLAGSGLATNIDLFGAGINRTIIQGWGEMRIFPGINTIMSDMTLNALTYWVAAGNNGYGNDTVRNTYWPGNGIDVIYLQATPNYGNVVFYNSTLTSEWDTINTGAQGTFAGNLIMIDSHLTVVLNNADGLNPSLVARGAAIYSGNLILINTTSIIYDGGNSCSACGANTGCMPVETDGGTAVIYMSQMSTVGATHGSAACDLDNVAGIIQVNYLTTYNSLRTTGTITQIGPVSFNSPSNLYSYPHSPVAPPVNNIETYTQNSLWGTGIFTANLIGDDSDNFPGFFVYNSITYNVLPLATAVNAPILRSTVSSNTLSSPLANTLPLGYAGFFWAAGQKATTGTSASGNWLIDSNNVNGVSSTVWNSVSIGHNSISGNNVGTWTFTGTANGVVLSGLAANVLYSRMQYGSPYFIYGKSTSNTLVFNVLVSNSFVILAFASGGNYLRSYTTNAPGNFLAVNTVSGIYAQSVIMTMNALAAGSYNAFANVLSTSGSSLAIAAYVWNPYTVTLTNNAFSTISFAGTNYANGTQITTIGNAVIIANPSSGFSFNQWVSSDTKNIIVQSTSSATTNVIVEGPGTLQALWNGFPALYVPTLTSSPKLSNTMDVNTVITFTATNIGGGAMGTGYTVNYIVSNSVTNAVITFQRFTGVTTSSNSFAWNIPASALSNSISANVFVTDQEGTPVTTNSVEIQTLNINQPFLTATINPSPAAPSSQATGNTIVFTATWSGGTSTFSANYLISNSITNVIVASQLYTGLTGTSNTFTWTIPSGLVGQTVVGNVTMTDNAAIPSTRNSVDTAAFTIVNPPLTVSSFTSSPALSATLDQPQKITFTATVSGGTGSYTYNYILTNTITNLVVASQKYSGLSSTTNTFTWTSTGAPQTIKANVVVTDTNPTTTNSAYIQTLTVKQALVAGAFSVTNTVIDSGQQVSSLLANPSLGAPSYTYLWYSGSSATCTSDSSSGITTSNYLVGPTSSTYYCYQVTDSATTPNVMYSATKQIIVNTALGSLWTASNGPVSIGQTQVLTANVLGGTTPYYFNVVVYNALGTLVYNSLSGFASSTSNVVSFVDSAGWNTGTFTANVYITDSASAANMVVSNSLTYTVTAAGTCFITLSNSVVTFAVGANSNTPTQNVITDTDSGGSAATTILIAGGIGDATSWYNNGIWVDTTKTNTIGVTNTVWAPTLNTAWSSGTALTNTITSTGLVIPNPSGGSASNTLYLGMGVPAGVPPTIYTTNIVIENSC